jgi:arginine utilization regulatory protein
MKYQEIMKVLSECGMGAVLVTENWEIREVNETGIQLLHGSEHNWLIGKRLSDIAAPLCLESEQNIYACMGFNEYLLRCPAPSADDLPEYCRLVVFRTATRDAQCDMFEHALEQVSDAVVMCDAETRINFLNNACIQMDEVVPSDVIGEKNEKVYEPLDGQELIIPQAIRKKQIYLGRRQIYTTRYNKNVDITSNTYPIIQNGQVLGGYSIMKDWSAVDSLNKKIVELQAKLIAQSDPSKHTSGKSALTARYHFEDIMHISDAMENMMEQCRQAAKSDSSVMIYGETGTGKELLAQSIHNASRRANGPFLAINCAAIPENLLEGLLFGTEKGAYTGAERRQGYFEQANNGTLLLDELNSMNINLQAKLLRVLQDGMVRRVGGSSEIHVDVRVLSNLNIPPQQAIDENKLRCDLFYRLGVVNIAIPPLRERKEDIPLLAKQFIMKCNAKLSRNARDLSPETQELFQAYDWPGNVRELEHAIEHAINVLPDDESLITPEYIPGYMQQVQQVSHKKTAETPTPQLGSSLNSTIKDVECNAICKILKENGGNISESARVLKMSRQSLQYRIRKYGINVKEL